MVHTNKEINYKESQSRWMERMESGGGDAEQDEEKKSGERWTRRARGKEKLISSWSNLSFITLMEKQREQRGARLQKKNPKQTFIVTLISLCVFRLTLVCQGCCIHAIVSRQREYSMNYACGVALIQGKPY